MPPGHANTAVLVEGDSDREAIRALARSRGNDLEGDGVAVLAMGGVTNIGHFVTRFGPGGLGLRLAGLCDIGEVRHVGRALRRVHPRLIDDPEALARHGFFVCDLDLEDELIRALGVPAVLEIIDSQGELRALRSLQQQPAQRSRPVAAQLRRFMGSRGGRKIQYAPLLTAALPPGRTPEPLDRLLSLL